MRLRHSRILCGFFLAATIAAPYLVPASRAIAAGRDEGEECTIAVITGRATPDGRPILWKNRDTSYLDNEVSYFDDGIYSYVTLVNAGETNAAWVGVNERGFAVLNALSYNIPDNFPGGITNGELMKQALQTCATVEDFTALMLATNKTGRANPANLAVLDAQGGARMYEAGNLSFVFYDANDTKEAPLGFIARTNFSMSFDTTGVDTYRYHRCRRLIEREIGRGGIDTRTVFTTVARDLRSSDTDPYPLPYDGAPPGYPSALGYVNAANTINRRSTVASGAILGVRPGEDPLLSTFFVIFGQPVVSTPVPVWVAGGPTPPALDGPITSPFCDTARARGASLYDYPMNGALLDTRGIVNNGRLGFLSRVERIERQTWPEIEEALTEWREAGAPPAGVSMFEWKLAADIYAAYATEPGGELAVIPALFLTPNPARTHTTISWQAQLDDAAPRSIGVYDPLGRRIRHLPFSPSTPRQAGEITWDARDDAGRRVAPGVYFLSLDGADARAGARLIVIP